MSDFELLIQSILDEINNKITKYCGFEYLVYGDISEAKLYYDYIDFGILILEGNHINLTLFGLSEVKKLNYELYDYYSLNNIISDITNYLLEWSKEEEQICSSSYPNYISLS